MRRCNKCGVSKPTAEFTKHAAAADGIRAICKECSNAQAREWKSHNKERVAKRMKEWRANNKERCATLYKVGNLRKYNLTLEQYEQMLSDQGGLCAICFELPRGKRALHIDHDHACCPEQARSCGKCVRGLVCHHCNIMLANARDSVERLADAIVYLLDWENNQGQQINVQG